MEERGEFAALPRPVQVQLAIFGPLLFGMIAGFLLGETDTGYWIITALATIGGVLGGMEHVGARDGAIRGVAGGFFFGLGIVIADAIADNVHQVEVPDPIIVLVIVTTIAGTLLGALGGAITARGATRAG